MLYDIIIIIIIIVITINVMIWVRMKKKLRSKIIWVRKLHTESKRSFDSDEERSSLIHSAVCLMTGPQSLLQNYSSTWCDLKPPPSNDSILSLP
jgi:hypothetical protein